MKEYLYDVNIMVLDSETAKQEIPLCVYEEKKKCLTIDQLKELVEKLPEKAEEFDRKGIEDTT